MTSDRNVVTLRLLAAWPSRDAAWFDFIFCKRSPRKGNGVPAYERLDHEARSKGLPLVTSFQRIAARALIWLTAISVPAQSLPAASCGCARENAACCRASKSPQCCCAAEKVRERRCCCARQAVASQRSCCCEASSGAASLCQCGAHCQCRKTQAPPAAPPVENERCIAEKLVKDAASAAPIVSALRFPLVLPSRDRPISSSPLTALDRCVSLGRLTL